MTFCGWDTADIAGLAWFGLLTTCCAIPTFAAAEPNFEFRATGHLFQCGPRAVEFGRGGVATLSVRDDPAIRTATRVTWQPARVKLAFGAGAPPFSLSEFGTTTFLKAPDGTVPCVKVR